MPRNNFNTSWLTPDEEEMFTPPDPIEEMREHIERRAREETAAAARAEDARIFAEIMMRQEAGRRLQSEGLWKKNMTWLKRQT